MAQQRLDLLLVQQGIASGRDQAKAFILSGQVQVDGQRVDKAGAMVPDNAQIVFSGNNNPYVSRGGLKLAKALDEFAIDLAGRRVLDLGASTGGFTDCALQNGATEVIAVDVGYGQLAWSLRNDSRVRVLERTNARYLTAEAINGPVDFVTADLAFISLTKVLPILPPLMNDLPVMIWGSVLTSASLYLFLAAPTSLVSTIGMLLIFGLFVGLTPAGFMTYPIRLASRNIYPIGMSVMNSGGNVGGFLSPLLAGALLDHYGDFTAMFWYFIVCGLCSAGFALLVRRPASVDSPEH